MPEDKGRAATLILCVTQLEPQKIRDWDVIGTGAQYAYVFMKASYYQTAFMDGMAGIASFVVRAIEHYAVDESVGTDEDRCVQIWKFPKKAEPYEVNGEELKEIMQEAEERLRKFTNFLVLGRTKA